MIESYADIQKTLAIAGRDLTFTIAEVEVVILGTLGWSTHLLQQEPAFADVEQMELNIYVATKDCVDNSIVKDMTFTIADDVYVYTLQILRDPIFMHNNWSRISATYISKATI